MEYRSLSDKILVREIHEEQKLGLLSFSGGKNSLEKGTIVSVGMKCTEDLKTGMTVLYKKEDAQDIEVEGESLKLLTERTVWIPETQNPIS